MPKSLIAVASVFLPAMLLAETNTYNITVENPLDRNRADCPVVIDLKKVAPGVNVTQAIVTYDGSEIATQIDDLDNDGIADEAAFVIDMGAKESKVLNLKVSDEGVQPEYSPRVWANFMLRGTKKGQTVDIREVTVPGYVDFYNMVYGHGPMFESELVGYRVYFNQKQTLDPYGKFNKGLELNDTKFYPTDEHIAQGYGDDVLTAGNSCGVGAFKGWNGTEATHIEPVKYRTERLVSAGPVRTIVEVDVDDWQYDGQPLDMTNRYTLYAGHRDLQIDVEFEKPLQEQIFSTGVERIMGDETTSWNDGKGLVSSWGRYYPVTDTVKFAKETIGIATYVPKKYIVGYAEDPSNFLYKVSAPGQKKLRYYTMFTSRKETFGFPDNEAWIAYLPQWREELDTPLIVNIEKD